MTNTKKKEDKWKTIRELFNDFIVEDTEKYQKKYGFEFNPEKGEHSLWNNEADAFKHAYMEAIISVYFGDLISHFTGWYHEKVEGKYIEHQSKKEDIMDSHNNLKGREIAKEVKAETIKALRKGEFTKGYDTFDIIAEKIIQRMNKGELILKPGAKPSKPKKQYPTGLAANISDGEKTLLKAELIKQRLEKEWADSAKSKQENTKPI